MQQELRDFLSAGTELLETLTDICKAFLEQIERENKEAERQRAATRRRPQRG